MHFIAQSLHLVWSEADSKNLHRFVLYLILRIEIMIFIYVLMVINCAALMFTHIDVRS